MNESWMRWLIILWLIAVMIGIIMLQSSLNLGIYLIYSLVVLGIVFYGFCKYREYMLFRQQPRQTPVPILPPSLPPKPPIVIVEGGVATHVGILMEDSPRPVSLYVPIYVAHV